MAHVQPNKGREDPCRKTDVGRRFSCALPLIFGVTEPVWLPKTSYCMFGHDHILKCPNMQWTDRQTDIHLDKDILIATSYLILKTPKKMSRWASAAHSVLVGGEREYACTCVFPQFSWGNLILVVPSYTHVFYRFQYNSDKACFGPAPEGER